jgi:ATP-dependent Zn protease
MTAIAQRLDRKLRMKSWRPQTAREVKARVAELITLAHQDAVDLAKSRRVEQEVLDFLHAPAAR